MICCSSKELLVEIKKYMNLNDISMKSLAATMNKSQQSVSQIFNNGNPKISTIFDICDALNLELDIKFCKKSWYNVHLVIFYDKTTLLPVNK